MAEKTWSQTTDNRVKLRPCTQHAAINKAYISHKFGFYLKLYVFPFVSIYNNSNRILEFHWNVILSCAPSVRYSLTP